jgi:hypothetical protein
MASGDMPGMPAAASEVPQKRFDTVYLVGTRLKLRLIMNLEAFEIIFNALF